jgi:curved DNA-binding protein CbpA
VSWIQDHSFRSVVPALQTMDFAGLALSPEEGFVLSRVDGHSTIDEICMVTGLGENTTLGALAKLYSSKLIEIPGAPAHNGGPAEANGNNEADGPAEANGNNENAPPATVPFSLEEGAKLSEKKQREIHTQYYALETVGFYELLNLEKGCTSKDVQRAYRKVSMRFHPDRFFGKELGSYKAKLEAIFRHITNVVEYLTDDDERATYEASLEDDEPEAPVSQEVEPIRRRPRQLSNKDRLRRLGGAMGMSTHEVKAAARKRRGTDTNIPKPQPGALRTNKAPEVSAERKARIKKRRRKQTQQIMSPIVQRRAKAKRHYEEGIKALLAGNFAAAASNLKLATTFDPKNEEYAEKEQIATSRAREGSAAAYAKRASFEESVGRWEEAARLYCMAAERNPTVALYCLAADALSKGDDLKRAVEYATRAKDLEPNAIEARLSLGNAYLAAAMPKNARREVEYALNLDSDNRLAKTLMKEVKKADR